jgi:hypothetical protein
MISEDLRLASGLSWNLDPAASGMRSRAFTSDGFELLVYEPFKVPRRVLSQWIIRKPESDALDFVASGYEATGDLACERALYVLVALRRGLTGKVARVAWEPGA